MSEQFLHGYQFEMIITQVHAHLPFYCNNCRSFAVIQAIFTDVHNKEECPWDYWHMRFAPHVLYVLRFTNGLPFYPQFLRFAFLPDCTRRRVISCFTILNIFCLLLWFWFIYPRNFSKEEVYNLNFIDIFQYFRQCSFCKYALRAKKAILATGSS